MNRCRTCRAISGLLLLGLVGSGPCGPSATPLRPVVLDPSYRHDRFDTQPKDILVYFRAFTSSFDGADDDDGDGQRDAWGIPEWVSYELRAQPAGLGTAPDRPSPWIHDHALACAGIAPTDESYKHSGYSRGHLCMKHHAWRLGADADWNSHITFNAGPQPQTMNGGAWLALELLTSAWADRYGVVWITCGPIVYGKTASEWIGDDGEIPVAVPDAYFKIVAKESGDPDRPDVLAFIIPLHGVGDFASADHDMLPYLTSVDIVETLTGLDFLTSVPDSVEREIERVVQVELW